MLTQRTVTYLPTYLPLIRFGGLILDNIWLAFSSATVKANSKTNGSNPPESQLLPSLCVNRKSYVRKPSETIVGFGVVRPHLPIPKGSAARYGRRVRPP
jgi:hypothetical protein